MKRFFLNRWVLLTLRFLVGGILIFAGITKIQEPLDFADSIATFSMLPNQLINIFALGHPLFEIIVGTMLVAGWKRGLAAFAICLLTIIFAIALGQALVRGLEVDCGCFGSGKPSVLKTWASLSRDILVMAASLWLYIVSLICGRKGVLDEPLD